MESALQHFVLLAEREASFELVVLAVFGLWSTRPIHLKERTGNVGHPQSVLLQNSSRFLEFIGIEIQYILIPQFTQFHPFHSEFIRGNFTSVAKILCDLVADDADSEGRRDAVYRNFGLAGFLLIVA